MEAGGSHSTRLLQPSASSLFPPVLPHSSIPSSSLLQRRAAGRGCLRDRLRSCERRPVERTGVGGTAAGGGPEPQTHTHAEPQSQSHTARTHTLKSTPVIPVCSSSSHAHKKLRTKAAPTFCLHLWIRPRPHRHRPRQQPQCEWLKEPASPKGAELSDD